MNYNIKEESEYKKLINDIYILATTSNIKKAQDIYEKIYDDCLESKTDFIKTMCQGLYKAKSLCCGVIDTSRFLLYQKAFNIQLNKDLNNSRH